MGFDGFLGPRMLKVRLIAQVPLTLPRLSAVVLWPHALLSSSFTFFHDSSFELLD